MGIRASCHHDSGRGIPDIAIDGENALLFSPGDTTKLSEHLKRLIDNPAQRKHIAQNSKYLANTKFNIESINQQIGELYKHFAKL